MNALQRKLFLRASHGLESKSYKLSLYVKQKSSLDLKPVLCAFSKELKFLWIHGLVKVLSKTLAQGVLVNNQEPEWSQRIKYQIETLQS